MVLKFEYLPRVGPAGIEYDPTVDVVFTNPKNGASVEARCLIDSGASSIVLNGEFAEVLGIDLRTGKEHKFQGIKGDPAVGYDHLLNMRLKQDTNEFLVECSLVPELKTTGLLGQKGFFENYRVVFERAKKRIELTPLSPAKKG